MRSLALPTLIAGVVGLHTACDLTSAQPDKDLAPEEESDADTDADADADADVDTDTDTGGLYKTVKVMTFNGWFGYDAASGSVVPVTSGAIPIAPSFNIYLGTDSWTVPDFTQTDDYCTITVDLDGYVGEPFATANGYLLGFMIPQGMGSGSEDCLAKGFDPGFFNIDPLTDFGFNGGFGLSIGGDLDPAVESHLTTIGVAPYLLPQYAGGEILDGLAIPYLLNSVYFNGYAVDPTFEVDLTSPLDRTSMDDGFGGLSTGYYEFSVIYYWTFF